MAEHLRRCRFCSREFLARDPRRVYCSNSCKQKWAYWHQHLDDVVKRTCKLCNREFWTSHGCKAYCSPGCRRYAKYLRQNGHRPRDRHEAVCQCCGLRFVTRRAFQKYCSPRCRNRINHRRHWVKVHGVPEKAWVLTRQAIQQRIAAVQQRWTPATREKRKRGRPAQQWAERIRRIDT